MLHMRVILPVHMDDVEDGHVAHEGDITCVHDDVKDGHVAREGDITCVHDDVEDRHVAHKGYNA